jgi:hypothetical protein
VVKVLVTLLALVSTALAIVIAERDYDFGTSGFAWPRVEVWWLNRHPAANEPKRFKVVVHGGELAGIVDATISQGDTTLARVGGRGAWWGSQVERRTNQYGEDTVLLAAAFDGDAALLVNWRDASIGDGTVHDRTHADTIVIAPRPASWLLDSLRLMLCVFLWFGVWWAFFRWRPPAALTIVLMGGGTWLGFSCADFFDRMFGLQQLWLDIVLMIAWYALAPLAWRVTRPP